jgi:FkbM family methyltransferase
MRPYLIRRALIIFKVLKLHENIWLADLMIALFIKNKRKELLGVYSKSGIKEAKKYFVIDCNSGEGPFIETFILKMYEFCDFSGKVVIDIGAQTGDSTLYFSLKGAKMIYAFEPLKGNYRILEKNVTQNKINCKCFNIALGNATQDINVSVSGNMAIATSFGDYSELENIKMNKLDNLDLNADIIKIDVEGFETEVLRGGLNTINNAKDIIIETHSNVLQAEVAELLSKMGFHLSKIIKNYLSKSIRVEYWKK